MKEQTCETCKHFYTPTGLCRKIIDDSIYDRSLFFNENNQCRYFKKKWWLKFLGK